MTEFNLKGINISPKLQRAYKSTIISKPFLQECNNLDPEEKTLEAFKRLAINIPHAFDSSYDGDKLVLALIT